MNLSKKMNQQNSKTHVQQLLYKARTRHIHFLFGLTISQGHNSFECLFKAYSELWRTRKIEQQMMTGMNSWPKNCHHQLLPCYLEVMQADFLNGSTTGIWPHVQLSHNSTYASAYIAPFHPSLHCSNNTLHRLVFKSSSYLSFLSLDPIFFCPQYSDSF